MRNQNTGDRVESAFETVAPVTVEEVRRTRKKSTEVVGSLERFMTRRHRFGEAGIMRHVVVGLARQSVRGEREFNEAAQTSVCVRSLNNVRRESEGLARRKPRERTRRKAFRIGTPAFLTKGGQAPVLAT